MYRFHNHDELGLANVGTYMSWKLFQQKKFAVAVTEGVWLRNNSRVGFLAKA